MTEPVEVVDETPEQVPEPEPEQPAEPTPEEQEAGEEEEQPETPAEPEQLAEPGAVVGMGEKELEKMQNKLATARNSYARKLGDILGEEATQLEPCPRCIPTGIAGFIFPPTMAPIDAEAKAAVMESVGEAPAMATEAANFARRCHDCDGNGVVLSGSRRNDQKTIRCRMCEGRGYVWVGDPPPGYVAEGAPPASDAVVNGVKEDSPSTDLWGRPAGHPDYGVHPMYVGQA